MSRVLFSNAAFLAGLAALAIPILIHLFLRRKRLRLRFSTLQFFVKQDEKAGRRRKWSNWLLLATRLLLLALVVVAFARPYWRDAAALNGGRKKRQVVFVLDRSASMQAKDGDVTRWSKAKDILRRNMSELGLDDRVALVDCAAHDATISPLVPPEVLKLKIEQLEPGFGTGDVGDGLQEAVKILSAKDLRGELSIYVISDLQRQSSQKLDSVSIPQNVELNIFSVGATNTPNVAISDLTMETGNALLQATVANYSEQDAAASALDWVVDGRAASSVPMALGANATTNVTAPLPALRAGWHQIEAHLQSHDPYALDDVRYQVLQVPAPLKVLCIETRQTKHVFEEESFFLVSALQPGFGETNAPPSLFDVEKVSADAMVGKLAGGSTSPYKIVLVPALRQLPDGCGQALLEFARHGGGVLLFVGDGLSASHYDAELGGLLPATLDQIEGDTVALEHSWRLREFDAKSTVFAAFRRPRSGDLTLPEFWRRYVVTPVDSAQVLARFRDSTPFLVCQNVGQGRVVLVNTSADTSWSDWPKHKTFVPWLHGVCHYLAGDDLSLGTRPENSFVAGATAELDLGTANGKADFRIRPPAGAEFTVKADDQGKIELPLERPGFYSVLDSAGQTIRLLAVNTPQRESNLAGITESEFQGQLVRSQATPTTGTMAGLFGPADGQTNFWRALMMAGAVILVLETVLANRTFA
ncbi:MAG TPA: VWA domain-containing protein [Verrucomicrobiae bacterium]|jgi:hypothetical protein|nr:VWA domain-containing protein [Verrucomicrobiae bacterium]